MPDDMRVLVTDPGTPDAYPISGFSWVLVYTNQPDARTGHTLASYLWWQIHVGQKYAEKLNYAPLPESAVTKAEALILSMRCGDEPCLVQAQAAP
jgi:phosphate transport system substrate-binding protein